MTLDISKSVDIIETMENYIDKVRPEPEIRAKLDIGYEIKDKSVILHEIRPVWNNPNKIQTLDYAKATFAKDKNVWKIFWQRADLKWHSYKPQPTVKHLSDFLRIVDEDEHFCFKG